MMDHKMLWSRLKGRWHSMRRVPALFVFGYLNTQDDLADSLADFGRWCASNPGTVCRVGLSSRWLLFSLAAPELDQHAARQQAMQQWAHYLDVDDALLKRDWLIREVRVGGANLLCAGSRALTEGLQSHARNHGVKLDWVGPWWAHGVQTWLSSLRHLMAPAQGLWTLNLIEPDLVTHVQVVREPDQTNRLIRVWVDRSLSLEDAGTQISVALAAPQCGDALPHLWDHGVLHPVLTGMAPCWVASA